MRRNLLVSGLVLFLWISAPVAAIAYLTLQQQAAQFGTADPVLVSPEENHDPIARPVSLLLTWDDDSSVVAPAWVGVVQAVYVPPGAQLKSGDPIALISNLQRIGYASAVPFTRTLTVGSTGPDVAALNTMLASRGLSSTDGDRYTSHTRLGVNQFAASIGETSRVTAFDPAWVIYLARDGMIVSASKMVVGAPAPGAGSDLFDVEPELTKAELIAAVVIDDGSSETPAAPQAPTPITAGDNELLLVGATELRLDGTGTQVSPAELSHLRTIVKMKSPVAGAVLRSESIKGTWKIPTATLVSDAGLTCVVVQTSGRIKSVEVSVLGETHGVAVVEGDLSSGDHVVVAPAPDDRRCS